MRKFMYDMSYDIMTIVSIVAIVRVIDMSL